MTVREVVVLGEVAGDLKEARAFYCVTEADLRRHLKSIGDSGELTPNSGPK